MKIGTAPIRVLPAIAAAAICSATMANCNEQLLYDNGFPNACNGTASGLEPKDGSLFDARSADDFTLSADTTIGGVHWYTDDVVPFDWSGQVVVEFYSIDGSCLPDTELAALCVPDDGGRVTQTTVQSPGPFAGTDRRRYDVSSISVDLAAGSYFLALMPVTTEGGVGQVFWETSRCGANGDAIVGCEMAFLSNTFGNVDWTPGSDPALFADVLDLNFQLTTCDAGGGCACDFDNNGAVDVDDLLTVIGSWGIGNPGGDCTGDGNTGVDDLLLVLAEWGLCTGPGAADECDDAILVFQGTYEFDNTDATSNGVDPAFACGTAAGNDIWFCLKAECNDQVTVSLCDDATAFDTVLEVWETVGGCDALVSLVDCNDNGPGACGNASEIQFLAEEGQHYKIRIGGDNGETGTGVMNIFCGSGEANTECADATEIAIGDTVFSDTTASGVDAAPTCGPDNVLPVAGGLWYSVTGDGSRLRASTCVAGTAYDTALNVYCGGCGLLNCIGSSDNDPVCFVGFVGESTVEWDSEAGEVYLILVHGGQAGAEGEFGLSVTSVGASTGNPPSCIFVCEQGVPVNDCCDDRINILDGVTAFSTVGAITEAVLQHTECGGDGQTYDDIWYNYTATCTGLVNISTCSDADFDTQLVLYDGCGPCYDLTLLQCNDDGVGCANNTSSLTAPVVSGNCYKLRVGGFDAGNQGTGNLTITCLSECLDCVGTPENPVQACPVDGDAGEDDPNGGCNSDPVSFDSISDGETVCGETGTYLTDAGLESRDTDWFLFTVPAGGGTATVTVEAEFPSLIIIVDGVDTCAAPGVVVLGNTVGDCQTGSISAFLAEGSYAAFIAFDDFSGLVCTDPNEYAMTLDVDTGSCTFECPPGSATEGEACLVDDAVDTTNGGCNSTPAVFGTMPSAGTALCGIGSTYLADIDGDGVDDNLRDTDWYLYTHGGGDLTITCNSEFPALYGVVTNDNNNLPSCDGSEVFVVTGTTAGNCDETSATATGLAAGTYVIFASPNVFDGFECSTGLNDYWIRVD